MMKNIVDADIKKKIEMFLTPKTKKNHGRPISVEEAIACGLNVESIDIKSKIWQTAYELFMRTDNFVSNHASKCIETKNLSFATSKP